MLCKQSIVIHVVNAVIQMNLSDLSANLTDLS